MPKQTLTSFEALAAAFGIETVTERKQREAEARAAAKAAKLLAEYEAARLAKLERDATIAAAKALREGTALPADAIGGLIRVRPSDLIEAR
jgi:predicted DNA-binding transcriptional regulator YafY